MHKPRQSARQIYVQWPPPPFLPILWWTYCIALIHSPFILLWILILYTFIPWRFLLYFICCIYYKTLFAGAFFVYISDYILPWRFSSPISRCLYKRYSIVPFLPIICCIYYKTLFHCPSVSLFYDFCNNKDVTTWHLAYTMIDILSIILPWCRFFL